MKISCLNDLAERAKEVKKKPVTAVVHSHDGHTLEAVVKASEDGIVSALLIGDAKKTEQILLSLGANPKNYEILDSQSVQQSLQLAVKAVNDGVASAMMKGMLESAEFLKAVLHRENGLAESGSLSLTGLFETPGYHKVFAISDIAFNTYPGLECKKAIIENAVDMLLRLGYENPKVAVLAAVEKVNPKMPEAVDADALKEMNINGEIKNCIVEGPISFDLATLPGAAEIKGYDSPVAGDADLLIVPDVACGNILSKCLTGMCGASTAGTVLGAKIPVILTSRSAEASDKYYSIALAACIAKGGSFKHG